MSKSLCTQCITCFAYLQLSAVAVPAEWKATLTVEQVTMKWSDCLQYPQVCQLFGFLRGLPMHEQATPVVSDN